MTTFRLQVFDPATEKVPVPDVRAEARLLAECEQKITAAREEAYRTGFLAGQSTATESFLDDQARLTSQLIEALNDARLGNEAARRYVTASIAPVVEAVCKTITPVLAENGYLSEVVGLVMGAIQACPEARPRLRCAPEMVVVLTSILAERGIDAIVEEAPELLPREAQIFWDQGYDHLDLDACVAQIEECLSAHLQVAGPAKQSEARRHG